MRHVMAQKSDEVRKIVEERAKQLKSEILS